MARTLFIIDDTALQGLDSTIIKKMEDELKSIFSFASKFTILRAIPKNLPEKIDFTDSIVKVVAKDEDVAALTNQAQQQQSRSQQFDIQAKKLNVKMDTLPSRVSGLPERGGIGWHAKNVVTTGGMKLALVKTGGIVSMESAALDVLTFHAPNKWDLKEAEKARDGKLAKAKLAHGKEQEEKAKEAHAAFDKSKKHWALQGTAPKSWPPAFQETVGIVLGRMAAHEARHQYIADPSHFEDGGLGGDGPEMIGVPSSEKFHADDEKSISARLTTLETEQKTATHHIATFPRGQAFAFQE
jgi:hypothetical protein